MKHAELTNSSEHHKTTCPNCGSTNITFEEHKKRRLRIACILLLVALIITAPFSIAFLITAASANIYATAWSIGNNVGMLSFLIIITVLFFLILISFIVIIILNIIKRNKKHTKGICADCSFTWWQD